MLMVGYFNTRELQESYKKSFFESAQEISKGNIKAIEYGLKYGKSISSFYTAPDILNEIHDYISSSENVSIIASDGSVFYTLFPKKTLTPSEYKTLLNLLDVQALAKNGVQIIQRENTHHEFMPIRGADGAANAYLEITFDDDLLKSKTISFNQSSALSVLIVTLLGTILFMVILSRVRTTNEKGEVKRGALLSVMIINITICQLTFTGINLWMYRNVLVSNAKENTRFAGEIIRKYIDTVTTKGVTFQDLENVQGWMASVIFSADDIKGAIVSVNNGKVTFSSTNGLDPNTGSNLSMRIVLQLKPDVANNQANLTMVLASENLNRKLFPMLMLSMIILIASIAALVQATFIMIFIFNRRAILNLKKYNEKLERIVMERTREIQLEKEKSDRLLLNILPKKVADELKENGFSEPQAFDNVSVFFSDVVGFTTISKDLEAKYLIKELSEIFTNFDLIIEKYNCQRIKTIGDAYLCVSGMPDPEPRHAHNLVNASLDIIDYLVARNKISTIQWNIRIGINTGSVVGGIVGIKKYLYDVFGDTINTASRMESNSETMRINVSERTWELVRDEFNMSSRGDFEVKGKGIMRMYFVEGKLH